jgi:hypothetical protein
MNIQKGCLLTCTEDSVKQIVLYLDTIHHFILYDLDRYHVLIDSSKAKFVQSEVERILNTNINNLGTLQGSGKASLSINIDNL